MIILKNGGMMNDVFIKEMANIPNFTSTFFVYLNVKLNKGKAYEGHLYVLFNSILNIWRHQANKTNSNKPVIYSGIGYNPVCHTNTTAMWKGWTMSDLYPRIESGTYVLWTIRAKWNNEYIKVDLVFVSDVPTHEGYRIVGSAAVRWKLHS